jgi:hypothetical protein
MMPFCTDLPEFFFQYPGDAVPDCNIGYSPLIPGKVPDHHSPDAGKHNHISRISRTSL